MLTQAAHSMRALPPPTTCREFLGAGRGYCPAEPTVPDSSGRMFCPSHARARGIA